MSGLECAGGADATAAAKKAVAALSQHGRRMGRAIINDIGKAERGEAGDRAVRRLVDGGLMEWSDGRGAPRLTPVGTGFLMADGLGLTFFDICVLSVVYRFARGVSAGTGERSGSGGAATGSEPATVPMRTIQNYLVDWPYEDVEVRKSVSHLRAAGLLPRCRHKRVVCDVNHLAGLHDKLVEIDGWVESTSEQMRRILVAPIASR